VSVPLRIGDEEWRCILNAELGWALNALRREVIREQSELLVERLQLTSPATGVPDSVVAKIVPTRRESTAWALARPGSAESALHAALVAQGAPLARLHWSGEVLEGTCYAMVLEDLAASSVLFDYQHTWSREELVAVAEAVAGLHAAGARARSSGLVSNHPYLARSPLQYVDSAWIRGIADRAGRVPLDCQDPSVSDVLRRLADRYDLWMERLAPWQTTIHGDIFWGNVAVRSESKAGCQARLLDLDSMVLGLPQYDVEYLTQRGWQTTVDWDLVRRHHHAVLRRLLPGLVNDPPLWWWGYRVALVQLMLWWHWVAVGILDRGDQASDRERQWVTRGALFGRDFLAVCLGALEEEPAM